MIIVNDEEVQVESVENKVEILPSSRTEADGDNQYRTTTSTRYSFGAYSIDKKDLKYYEDIMSSEITGEEKNYPGTAVIYALAGEGWYLAGVIADQWMGVQVNHGTSDDHMVISCDFMENGILAAYLIAKQINENNENLQSTEES